MKRLHLISAMYVSRGHGYEYVRNFCKNLQSHFEIILHVATGKIIDTPPDIVVHYTNVEYSETDAKNFIKYSKIAPYIRATVKQFVSFKYFKKIIESDYIQKGDLVYIMDYDVLPLTYLVRGLRNKGVSNTYLWIHSARFESKDFIYSLYKSVFKYVFNKIILTNIQAVIVNGEYIKSEITKNLNISPEKIYVIQYPSEIPFKKLPKEKAREKLDFGLSDRIILFFGMLRTDKNIEFTIESVSKSKSLPKLIIAGSEASVTKQDIEHWTKRHGLKDIILDIDYITEEKMALYYSCSDLLILTYRLESGSQSGPLSLAREFELPALVTDTGEIGKYVVDNNVGFTADGERAYDFANKIDAFYNLNPIQKEEINNSLKRAKVQYSWNSATQKYLTLFNA